MKHIRESEKCEVLHAVSQGADVPLPRLEVPVKVKGLAYEAEQDLPGVCVYLDDILVNGTDPDQHMENLRQLLQ